MNKAFSLMELLFVVVMIGILSAVALPKYERSVRRAEMIKALTTGKTIYDAALRYKTTHPEPTTDFNQLDITLAGATGTGDSRTKGKITYQLLSYGVDAVNSDGGYKLRFLYPTQNENGVYAPIGCCPIAPATANATWLCNNMGQTHTDGIANMADCTEIK